jgi:uridine kinase
MTNVKVVAVSGVSGAGKTTVVKLLADEFNCPFLLFDDHVDRHSYPPDMKDWFQRGANVSLIKTPDFISALERQMTCSKTRFIFIEEPFGKERDSMARLIDYVIFLDSPMELCLARVIKRHTQESSMESILNYLNKYEDYFRDIYMTVATQVKGHADLIIHNTTSAQCSTKYISNWLKSHAS